MAYTSLPKLPLPHQLDVLDGVQGLTADQITKIRANLLVNETAMNGFRQDLVAKIGVLYDVVANSTTMTDTLVDFYFNLYSHCDGSLREFIRSKLACHFKENLREVVQAHDIPRAERDAQEERKSVSWAETTICARGWTLP